MNKVKQDLYGDGNVLYEYYEGSHIILRVCGFCIKIYKPYCCSQYGNKQDVYVKPKIEMSANTTILLNLVDILFIQQAIMDGIKILNKEGFNLIDVTDLDDNYDKIPISEVPEFDTSSLKEIKEKNKVKLLKPKANSLFLDKNRNMFMYLGKGKVYIENYTYEQNRTHSYEVYMTLYPSYQVRVKDDVIYMKGGYEDTYVKYKPAIEILKEYSSNIYKYVINNSKYIILREDTDTQGMGLSDIFQTF